MTSTRSSAIPSVGSGREGISWQPFARVSKFAPPRFLESTIGLLVRTLLSLALGALAARPALAQAPSLSPSKEPVIEAAPDSPRVSTQEYLDACRTGQYEEAARYLALEGDLSSKGPELARRLKAVLDQHLWINLSLLSPLSEGDQADGLGEGIDRLGAVPGTGGRPETIRLVRRVDADRVRWVFSSGTVSRIDAWYGALGDRWVRENLPEVLLRPGPGELLWWQWLALLPLTALAWLLGRLFGALSCRGFAHLSSRTHSEWDDRLISRLAGPLTLGWTLAWMGVFLIPLDLYAPADDILRRILKALGLVTAFWGLWRVVDLAAEAVRVLPWVQERPSARSMLGLGERFGKAAVVAIGIVAALSQLGYPVASLLAGLGLGGLVFALAAQKTVENVFGSVSLAADEPFRVGDFVKIEDFVGHVEAIGLRSTRIRTLDRTVIAIPNGRLADMRVESYTVRDRMRLACTVSLVYSTTAEQMRTVLSGLERVLRAHPKIWPDAVVVRFKELAASSLDIEIMAWFQTEDWGEFQLIRQDILIQFMDVVERAGSAFAFPTRTVHVQAEAKSPGA